MLTEVEVENFQSIGHVSLGLGWFTVITGQTGAGKSALLRAIRLAAFNRKGSEFVRHGTKKCRVLLRFEEDKDFSWSVAIERNAGASSKDAYQVTREVGTWEEARDLKTYTKLAGKVPDDIAQALRLSELNFAGQLDRPYLLDESGGNVAKTLGELTNVTVVLTSASRGAADKKALNAELKAAQGQASRLAEEEKRYEGLPALSAACAEAEGYLLHAQGLQARLERLTLLMHSLSHHQQLAAEVKVRVDRLTPPDTARLEELAGKLRRLSELLDTLYSAAAQAGTWAAARDAAEREESAAAQVLHDTLIAAGECPTCGRPITADGESCGQA